MAVLVLGNYSMDFARRTRGPGASWAGGNVNNDSYNDDSDTSNYKNSKATALD